jgi:leucyl aminopeptidase
MKENIDLRIVFSQMESPMKISFSTSPDPEDTLVIPMMDGDTPIGNFGSSSKKFIANALGDEKVPFGKTITLRGSGSVKKIILLGMGKKSELNEKSVKGLAAPLYAALKAEDGKLTIIDATALDADVAAHLANALLVESYEFKKYKTTAPAAKELDIHVDAAQKTSKIFEDLKKVTESSFWASDLANEPANVLNPETYAARIKAELEPLGIKVTVLEQVDMERLGMGCSLAVGRGSATPPRMVVMEYNNADGRQKQPLALVGKGLTFDSGGISIKPAAGMGDMTLDMGGSAAVVGAMRAIAARGAKTNVVAIVGLVENMPDGNAYRPGDILKSMNGKTVYVDNTDAEGRLVLCDALTYIQRNHNPHTVVDLATLTGAAVVALGPEYSAVYANDNKLWKKFNRAAAVSGERIWRMPLTETTQYAEAMKRTPLADLTNSGVGNRAGSCTAAAFLREFIEKDAAGNDKCKYMHIDMAGPGIPSTVRKGWGVYLLNQFVQDNCEATGKKAKAKKAAVKARKP